MQQELIDAELVAACKTGDRKAQEQVYRKYAAKMYAVCCRYTNDTMEAEDILMIGFAKVFTKINSYQAQGSFEGWIRTIIVNSAISSYQKKMRTVRTVSYDFVPFVSEIAVNEQKHEVDYLLKALQYLPAQYKQAFNLFVFEGYSHREIGEALSISETLSKVHVSRARKILQQKLNKVAARFEQSYYVA